MSNPRKSFSRSDKSWSFQITPAFIGDEPTFVRANTLDEIIDLYAMFRCARVKGIVGAFQKLIRREATEKIMRYYSYATYKERLRKEYLSLDLPSVV